MASGTIKAVVSKGDIVNNLTTNDSTKVLSAAQGKALKDAADTLNSKRTWIRLFSEDQAANASLDKTISVTYPDGYTEVMFTIQRVSNARTIASTIVPRGQFESGAIYACGILGIAAGVVNTCTAKFASAVAIDAGNNQIEVACSALDESLRFRVFAR